MTSTPLDLKDINSLIITGDTELISPHYLSKLLMWIIIFFGILFGFIWMVDPYGVSPIHINIPTINLYKPERAHIDRLIKPYEVWRYQPKTIFMGTSRIHQSMDPAIFDGTEYAPAYNAAIPASTLAENLAHIEQYIKLDPHIKHIFIELFLYNFVQELNEPLPKTWKEFFNNVVSLQFSSSAFLNSIRTVFANRNENNSIPAHINKRGYWVQSSTFNPASTFSDVMFIRTVLGWDKPTKMRLAINNFKYLDQIIKLARDNGIKLHFFVTPNYPWDDYRLLALGNWPILEEWLRHIAKYPDVVSFSQYNPLIEEEISNSMQWWNDPTHFSLPMGRKMLKTYLGQEAEVPDNFMRHINQTTIEAIIAERRAGLMNWVKKHPDFVMTFEDIETTSDSFNGTLNVQSKSLLLNEKTYPIRLGVGEVVLTDRTENSLRADGWTVDEIAKQPVKQIIATIGDKIGAQWFPTAPRDDIEMALGKQTKRSGFSISIPLKPEQSNEPIRIFAIMRDGSATQLTSSSPEVEGIPIQDDLGKIQSDKIIMNGITYHIVNRFAGSIESANPIYHAYQMNGWVVDVKAHAPVIAIIASIDSHVIAKSIPTIDRKDINDPITTGIKPIGFSIIIPLSDEQIKHPGIIKLYAVMADNVASPLNTHLA